METASPPVSPSVVAQIFIIQNASVTWGTLEIHSLFVFSESSGRSTIEPFLPGRSWFGLKGLGLRRPVSLRTKSGPARFPPYLLRPIVPKKTGAPIASIASTRRLGYRELGSN